MSGKFQVASQNYPDLTALRIGNNGLGWSYGEYDLGLGSDVFGTMLALKPYDAYCAIPLPTDLLPGDVIKICGNAWSFDYDNLPFNQINVGVGYIVCSDITRKINSPVFTLIPTFQTSFGNGGTACFSSQIELGITLPACDTMLVVGLLGSDQDGLLEGLYRFTYTLDAIKYCAGGNLLIRLCCEQAHFEIISNNGVAVGASFVDSDGYCWTVFEETTLPITGSRTKATDYVDCTACIAANPCIDNYSVSSCCGAPGQIFVPVLPGVAVGDTFVDTNGYCWFVDSNTSEPITNIVTADVVYNETNCESGTCTDNNPCPTPVLLESCCNLGNGYTTLEALQAVVPSLVINDSFVDTFGFCWRIFSGDPNFPTLSFITPVTDYGTLKCDEPGGCLESNPCPETQLYYTLQHCCTEEIEIVLLDPKYGVGSTLSLVTTTGAGCYEVLSWSDTGTATLTVLTVQGGYRNCADCIRQFLKYCQGVSQCCTEYLNQSGNNQNITGYRCDGTWLLDYIMVPEEVLCMAFVYNLPQGVIDIGCCSFDVYNPSLSNSIDVNVNNCGSLNFPVTIPPGGLLTDVYGCTECVSRPTGPWEYAPCP